MRALIVIPARHASTRLPGKPLLAETGKPLIVHVCEAAARVPDVRVLVATDHERILTVTREAGFDAVMTDPGHETGSARVAEAARGSSAGVVVNLQGDEPEVESTAIEALIELHEAASSGSRPALVSTLASPFPEGIDPALPSCVKVVSGVADGRGHRDALYFSRASIPFPRGEGAVAPLLHVGLYAFTPEGLDRFASLPPTPLERAESLEQLRVLEHGHRISMAIVPPAAPGIDTPADYAAFVARQGARGRSGDR